MAVNDSLHLMAVAATVLGGTGAVAMVAYRAALRWVDIDLLPGRILPRAVWWRDHVGPVLATSLLLVVAGLTGLVSG
jgi:hypothetical protein